MFTSLVVLYSAIIFANPVSSDVAMTIASNWYKHYASTRTNDFTINDVVETKYEGLTTYYTFIFNAGGFVMVSADDAVTPILGFSIDEPFDKNNIPPNARDFFNSYCKEIKFIVSSNLDNYETSKEWGKIFAEFYAKDIQVVAPMCSTTWDQSSPYNLQCPTNTYTGCVATAMAQIMKKWNYPTTGNGSHSYTHATYGTLSANFGTTTYQWTNMINSYPGTSAQNSAVATLMYHCGVSVNMDYSTSGSGAYTSDVPGSLINYFRYQPSAETKYQALYSSESLWTAMIKAEMDAGRPVLLAGSSTASGGHAFVCDGYNSANKYHINWGWSGSSDGYYYLNALNPSGYNFTSNRQAVVRITPLNANAPIADFTVDNIVPAIGAPVAFTDNSLHNPTTWTWTFEGGTPSTSSAQNPSGITFATNGYKIISLTVSNANGSDVIYKERYVKVGGVPSAWIKQNTAFSNASRGIDQVFIVGPNVVWAKAYDGTNPAGYIREFTRTNDGGTTWTPGTITFTNSANYGVSNIFAFSYTTAYACMFPISGTGGVIVKTTDGGATWTQQTTAPFTNSWADFVHFFDANNGVCMGDPISTSASDFVIYTTANGGTTWTQVSTSSLPNSQANECGVTNEYYAVGNTIWFSTTTGRVYKSTDKGLTWTVSSTGLGKLVTVTFKDANVGIAVMDTFPYTIKKTTNGGSAWSTITPTGYLVNMPKIKFVPGTSAMWVDAASYPNTGSSYSLNDCASFLNVDTGSVQYTSVSFYDINTGWAGSFNTNSSDGGIYKWNPSILSGAPVANFTANSTTVCQGTSVTFTDQSTNSPTSWSWTFNGGTPSTSNLQNPTVVYNTAGTYTVVLIATNASGSNTKTQTNYITVNALPVNAGTITGTATVCQGQSGTYSVGTITNATGYTWTLPTGATIASGSNTNSINVNFSVTASSGNITVQGTNSCGNGTVSPNYSVTLNPTNTITLTSAVQTDNQSVCINSAIVNITYSTTGATSASFAGLPAGVSGNWSANIVTISGASSAAGTYNYIINLTGGCGVVTKTGTITVYPSVAAAGSITGTASVCTGQSSVSYSVSPIAGATGYTWTLPFGATIASGSNTNSITVNFSGTASSGNITVLGTNACGSGTISAYAVSVTTTPVANAGTDQAICSGESIVLSASGGTSYAWSTGDNTQTTSVMPTTVTTYSVTVTTNGCSATDNVTITVNPTPPTPAITQNGNVLLSDATSGNQWYELSGGAIPSATNQYYAPTVDGNYFVIVTTNGCSSDTSNIIQITTGIAPVSLPLGILIYPNPVRNELFIENHSGSETNVEILNLIGQTLYNSVIGKYSKIDMLKMPLGVYLLKIQSEKGTVLKKIVKQ